jgi:hypothetical protein
MLAMVRVCHADLTQQQLLRTFQLTVVISAWTGSETPQVAMGGRQSAGEVVAEELGPSLRWATATTTRATRDQS